jgi:hypothetical protein
MWIVVPSTCCPSAPELEVSISASDWRSRLLERSALWRSKPMPAKSWLRAWKREGWMLRLFGRIYEPSTAARGVASWISSLAATRASRSARPANDSAQMTLDTCGLTSPAFFGNAPRLLHSLKTCVGTCLSACEKCAQSWKAWVTALTQRYAQRRKSARPTDESACSSWPTPQAHDAMSPKTPEQIEAVRNRSVRKTGGGKPGMSNLNERVLAWPTPSARDGDPRRGATSPDSEAWKRKVERGAVNAAGMLSDDLKSSAVAWATPTARDWKDGACATSKAPTNALLGRQVLRTPMAGGTGLVLSPQFVEMLMGWPIGWTVCGYAAMASCLSKPFTPSSSCGDER